MRMTGSSPEWEEHFAVMLLRLYKAIAILQSGNESLLEDNHEECDDGDNTDHEECDDGDNSV